MGHGTDVSSLETTATLDLKTDEWIINTPNIRATKFWPGALGIQSNYALTFARGIFEKLLVRMTMESYLS